MRRVLLTPGIAMLTMAALALPVKSETSVEFHRTFDFSPEGRVALENINGDVHIRAWDRNEVRVDAITRAGGQEQLEEARIAVEAGPNVITIKTRYPESNRSGDSASVEYTVTVPRRVSLDEIKLVNGRLDISGVAGEVRASTVNGAVKAESLAGDVKLSTVNGTLAATFVRLTHSNSITLSSINGAIVLAIPYDAHAELRATNVSGGIRNDFDLPVDEGGVGGSRLNATLHGGGARIKLNNVNGGISIVPKAKGRPVRFT